MSEGEMTARGRMLSNGQLVEEVFVQTPAVDSGPMPRSWSIVGEEKDAKARVAVSRTFNLGDFESLRIEVGVELPCVGVAVASTIETAKELAVESLKRFAAEAGVG